MLYVLISKPKETRSYESANAAGFRNRVHLQAHASGLLVIESTTVVQEFNLITGRCHVEASTLERETRRCESALRCRILRLGPGSELAQSADPSEPGGEIQGDCGDA